MYVDYRTFHGNQENSKADKVSCVAEVLQRMDAVFDADKAAGVDAIYQFDLSGESGGQSWVKIANGAFETGDGTHDAPTLTLSASAEDYLGVVNGDLNATTAFMAGKIKIKGDMGLALKLQAMFPFN
jgi:putative sterol carrier protein